MVISPCAVRGKTSRPDHEGNVYNFSVPLGSPAHVWWVWLSYTTRSLSLDLSVASGDSTSQARKLSHRHCNYKAYKKTVPYGEANADSITTLSRDNPSRENCSQLCCRAGAEMCQYAWLFNNHCYGVACHHNKTLCEPTRVVFNSTYIMVNSQSLVEGQLCSVVVLRSIARWYLDHKQSYSSSLLVFQLILNFCMLLGQAKCM